MDLEASGTTIILLNDMLCNAATPSAKLRLSPSFLLCIEHSGGHATLAMGNMVLERSSGGVPGEYRGMLATDGAGLPRGKVCMVTSRRERQWRTPIVLSVASAIGLFCFLYPFILPVGREPTETGQAHATIAPLLFAGVSGVCLVAMLVTLAGEQQVSRSRSVALLGVLVAIDATLRLVPSLLGATAIFLLVMLVGAVFGASLGFQMGVLTLLFSATITGGIGPWLPFQMLAAGWVGMTASWLPRSRSMRARVAMLAVFGACWGLLFGALMNLWFWPFAAPGVGAEAGLYWSPDLSVMETVRRYGAFYLVTSFGFDLARSIGNVVLVLVFGAPVLRLLERYRSRFSWQPWAADETTSAPHPVGDR